LFFAQLLISSCQQLNKNGPIAGATFRGNEMVGMSGKAMHGTVPPGRTAFLEVTQIKESEGHTWFAASLLTS
jgi:hypothetical protein